MTSVSHSDIHWSNFLFFSKSFSEAEEYQPIAWKKVVVGDFVKLRSDESIPADILLLDTSDANSVCHIETANLDGETNLKQREVVKGLHMVIHEPVRIRYIQYSPEQQVMSEY